MKRIPTVVLMIVAAMAIATSALAQGTVSDNDCTISLGPTTVLLPKYGDDPIVGTAGGIFIMTADFATQGCTCTAPGDIGFDNPDEVKLVTPAGTTITPFRFNDIDGYAQFEYSVTEADVAAGGGVFKVEVYDSCGGEDVLVDSAEFDVDFDIVAVPKPYTPPPQEVIHACVNKTNGMLRIVPAAAGCRQHEYPLELLLPSK